MSFHRQRKSSLREGYFLSSDGLNQPQKRPRTVNSSSSSSSPNRLRYNLSPDSLIASARDSSHSAAIYPQVPTSPRNAALLLIATSGELLESARKNAAQALTSRGRLDYCSLILTAIKCLLLVIRKYSDHLSPKTLAMVRYKLARLYHFETTNSDLAQEYANEANRASSKHNFLKLAFASDILLAQILASDNAAFFMRFLEMRIADYKNRQCKGGASIFMLYKLNFLMTNDPSTALVLLQDICANTQFDRQLRKLCVLLQSNIFLLRGSLVCAKELLELAQSLLNKKGATPHQFTAMHLMLSLLFSMRSGDITHAQLYSQKLNLFIRSQQDLSWPGWESTGLISFPVDASIENSTSSLMCLIRWQSQKEFMLNFNLIAAASLLRQPPYKRSKAIAALQKTDLISTSLIKSMTDKRKARALSRKEASRTLCRLQYIRFTAHIYRTWAGFLDGDFEAIKYMNEFMQLVNKRQFLSSERLFYPLIAPRLLYIFAVYYHYHGDLQMAKYFYMKVRNAVCEPVSRERTERSHLQLEMGVGSENLYGSECLNELYVYSTMNLVLLNEYECKRLFKDLKHLANPQLRLNNLLYRNLMALFAEDSSLNKFKNGFAKTDDVAVLSYYAILGIFSNSFENGFRSASPALNLMRGKMLVLKGEFCFPFFQALVNFRLCMERADSPDSDMVRTYCKEIVSRPVTTDLEKSLFALILKYLVSEFIKTSESHKASVAQLQLEQYLQEISHKIKSLRASAKVETCDTA